MEEKIIIATLRDLYDDYKFYKDDGTTLIKEVGLRIINSSDKDREQVLNFFLKEIQFNNNDLWSLCLETIVELRYTSLGSQLESFYLSENCHKDDSWIFDMVKAMLKIQHNSLYDIYYDYIKELIKEKPGNGYLLSIYYCSLEPKRAASILSDFYSVYLNEDKIPPFIDNCTTVLFNYALKNPINYIPELVRITSDKDKRAGLNLKKMLLTHLEVSKIVIDKSKEQLILQLNKF
jgi:hypothetical protein